MPASGSLSRVPAISRADRRHFRMSSEGSASPRLSPLACGQRLGSPVIRAIANRRNDVKRSYTIGSKKIRLIVDLAHVQRILEARHALRLETNEQFWIAA